MMATRKATSGTEVYSSIWLADVHMSNHLPHSKRVGGVGAVSDRFGDQLRLWDGVIEIAKGGGAEAVYILGDLFDKSLVDAVTLTHTVDVVLKLASDFDLQVYILPGNHDAVSVRGERFTVEAFGRLRHPRIKVLTAERFSPKPWLTFASVPYGTIEEIAGHVDRLRGERGAGYEALLLHGSVFGARHEGWVCDDGLRAEEICRGWDAVFAGHFHTHQSFSAEPPGMYIGAPMQFRFDDEGDERGFLLATWGYDGHQVTPSLQLAKTTLPQFHTLRVRPAEVAPALERLEASPDDYVRVVVSSTHPTWRKHEAEIRSLCEAQRVAKRLRLVQVVHDPQVQQSARLTSEIGKSGFAFDIPKVIDTYVEHDSVDVGELSRKALKATGWELLAEVRADPTFRERSVHTGGETRVRRMEVTDWGPFQSLELDLDSLGLTFVGGENHDSDSAENNGTGKTKLFEALAWGFFGDPALPPNDQGDAIIRDGTAHGVVCIRLVQGDGEWKIERGRRKGKRTLDITGPNGPLEGSYDEMQAVIHGLLGLDWQAWSNTVHFAQGAMSRFVHPRTTDAERKRTLYRILRGEIFERLHKLVLTRAGALDKEIAQLVTRVDRLTGQVEMIDLGRLLERSKEWEGERAQKALADVQEAKRLRAQADAVAADVPSEGELERARGELRDQRAKLAETDTGILNDGELEDREADAADDSAAAAAKVERLEAEIAGADALRAQAESLAETEEKLAALRRECERLTRLAKAEDALGAVRRDEEKRQRDAEREAARVRQRLADVRQRVGLIDEVACGAQTLTVIGEGKKPAKRTVDFGACPLLSDAVAARDSIAELETELRACEERCAPQTAKLKAAQLAVTQVRAEVEDPEAFRPGDDLIDLERRLVSAAEKARLAGQALARLEETRQALAPARKAAGELRKGLQELRAARAQRRKVQEAQDAVEALESKLATAQGRADELRELATACLRRAKALKDTANPYEAESQRAKERLGALRGELEQVEQERQEKTQAAALLAFWVKGWSPKGLPSFLLDTTMPFLTERSNGYLRTLADGDITLELSTQRELKTKGEVRDEIDVQWVIEGVRNRGPSGAQQKKLDLASSLALMDLAVEREGAVVQFLGLDEVLDGLDREGRARVLTLLQELRARRGSVLVVSHEMDVAEIFERRIHLVREGKVTRLVGEDGADTARKVA